MLPDYLKHVFGGEDEDRTHDLRIANAALSQLSYPPTSIVILYHTDRLIKANAPAGTEALEPCLSRANGGYAPGPSRRIFMSTHCDIGDNTCKPCEGGMAMLDEESCRDYLGTLDGWALAGAAIEKSYRFKNHYETMAFVNAVAWISHRQDHHPEITVGYADCRVRYWTHAVGGLSENDFICAAKVDRLISL